MIICRPITEAQVKILLSQKVKMQLRFVPTDSDVAFEGEKVDLHDVTTWEARLTTEVGEQVLWNAGNLGKRKRSFSHDAALKFALRMRFWDWKFEIPKYSQFVHSE